MYLIFPVPAASGPADVRMSQQPQKPASRRQILEDSIQAAGMSGSNYGLILANYICKDLLLLGWGECLHDVALCGCNRSVFEIDYCSLLTVSNLRLNAIVLSFPWLLLNCNLATVMNCKYLICRMSDIGT